jgi:hypothetical protein
MKQRKLQSGVEVPELDKPITLKVYTRCPEKYMLVDMETGEKYIGQATEDKNNWYKINDKQ